MFRSGKLTAALKLAFALAVLAGAQARAQTIPAPAGALPAAAGSTDFRSFVFAPPHVKPGRPGMDFTPTGAIVSSATVPAGGDSSTPPEVVLRHLPNNIQGFRLNGEVGASEWPIYLSEAQLRRKMSFRVGYLSAVSVMPEASDLTVSINDVVIGSTKIRAPNKVQMVDFDVPSNLLKPGFNAVRIVVDQRHRVDCSLEAAYELWTQIDPAQTGLLMQGGDPGAQDIGDLPALPPDAQGALPVRAVLPGRTSAANIERVIRAVQFISSVGHFEQPVVDVGPMASGDYGVNLVVGLYNDVAQIADLSGLGAMERSRLALLPATSSRRTTIVITGQTEEDVNHALAQFGEIAAMRGSEAGLRAANAFPGLRVAGSQNIRLRDLGVRSQEFSGHYFHSGFNVIMPADFYSADYAKVMLDLDGGYAPGLLANAQLIVSINGRNAVSASMPRVGGEIFKDRSLPLPLGYFRPGLNRIEIEAQLPAPEDAACDPLASIAAKKRFLFLDSTTLRIPELARIGRMPDLAVTATGGFPFIGGKKQPKLYMPSPDRESIAAAATLAGRMAASAGRPIDFRFTVTPPAVGSGSTLVIASGRGLDDTLAGAVGVDAAQLRRVWAEKYGASAERGLAALSPFDVRARNRLVLQKNLPAACHMSRRLGDSPAPAPVRASVGSVSTDDALSAQARPATPGAQERDLLAEWSNQQHSSGSISRMGGAAINGSVDAIKSLFSRSLSGAHQIAAAARSITKPNVSVYSSDNALLIAQALLGTDADDVWTLVAAPNSALLAESIACLSDPRVWRNVEGRVAMLDASDGRITSAPADAPRFVATQPLSVSNLRLIAASWLSINPGAYVAMTLALAVILAFATFNFVRNVGRRHE